MASQFKPKHPLHWPNVFFLTLSPLAAIVASIYYIPRYGITISDITIFILMFFATGLSITGGYHRHFSHLSYQAHPIMKFFYLIFGACAMENSALNWSSDHRIHHRYTDTDADPYNAKNGFFWSHIGWVLYQTREPKQLTNVGDLMKDPLVRWQHKYHIAIALVVGFGLPLAIGYAIGRPFGTLLWGALIRVVFVHHVTFFINSLAHIWGTQPFSRKDTSVDSWWLAFLTNGEGYHNFHHTFPSDYRNGIYWYQWDPTKWLIAGSKFLGLTNRLHRMPSHLILRARMEVDALDAEKRILQAPEVHHPVLRERLAQAKVKLDHALMQWGEMKAKYREQKTHVWREKVMEYEQHLQSARAEWRAILQSVPVIN